MYLVISFNDASFGLKVLKWFCEILRDLWRKNRCALRRCGFNMPLIFARSINLNLAKWFCYLSSLSSLSLSYLSLPLTFCLSANASLTNIITSCCEEILFLQYFQYSIDLFMQYTIHLFICIAHTYCINWGLFWELFCNTFIRIKIFQFIFNALKIVEYCVDKKTLNDMKVFLTARYPVT